MRSSEIDNTCWLITLFNNNLNRIQFAIQFNAKLPIKRIKVIENCSLNKLCHKRRYCVGQFFSEANNFASCYRYGHHRYHFKWIAVTGHTPPSETTT